MEDIKTYLKPGDCVVLRQRKLIPSPVMLVLRKETSLFTANNELQEAVFCTKDLILVEE